MFETRIEMGCHFQGFQRSKKGTVNNAIDPKESSKDLSTQCGKLRCLKDAQGHLFIFTAGIAIGEFSFVIHLLGNPLQHLVDINGRRNTHGLLLRIVTPTVFDTTRKAFARSETGQIWIGGHDSPNGAHVIVKINRMDGDPGGAGFSGRKRDRFVNGSSGTQGSFGVGMQSFSQGSTAMQQWLKGALMRSGWHGDLNICLGVAGGG
mmetsp:Transcript_11249/g.23015  ORF Transcript_11249/g.23015 Transcript_11249/m.23015 type:complete len:206 (-) Transcript_11249:51-668(-)